MQKTPVTVSLADFPQQLHSYLQQAQLFDSSCSPEAQVWFIDNGQGGLYLKRAAKDSLRQEAALTDYYFRKGIGPEVVQYLCADADWMLTRAAAGEDCTSLRYLAQPERLSELLGMELRALHEVSIADCPVKHSAQTRLRQLRQANEQGLFNSGMRIFEDIPADVLQCYRYAQQHAALLRTDTLIHGDYCLPNVVLNDWRFSAFIDVAHGGVGDRHTDLFWGIWSLTHNLGTDRYTDRFLDAYGRDRVDMLRLRAACALECFG